MRLQDVIIVLGPLVLLAFGLGIIDAGVIRFLVIAGVFLALAAWIVSRKSKSRSKVEEPEDEDREGR